MAAGRTRGTVKPVGGRGSAEAIEKRRVARQLNTLFLGRDARGKVDGRTEKRRQRMLKELREGRRGQPLKPIEIVTHAHELLELGETIQSIKKNGVLVPKQGDLPPDVANVAKRAQQAYGFHPEVWKLLGIDVPAAGQGKKR
jgi:hypothetical protein